MQGRYQQDRSLGSLNIRFRQAALVVGVALLVGCTGDEAVPRLDNDAPEPTESATTPSAPPADGPDERESKVRPVSVLGLAEQSHTGDRLRLGNVREQTSGYTSYDVTYRSSSTTRNSRESYTISGVLNVPTGRGPFPAVVLGHGYIDPAIYFRGQGMPRERVYLANRGYVVLHVDYRNHAESDDDPLFQVRMRLGYSADVINAVKALRNSPDVPVDADRIAVFGRSMGGGVILKALVAEPGVAQAAVVWASVSSMERDNYNQFIRPDPEDSGLRDRLARRYGTPEQNPQFWRENSSRPYLDQITEPLLMVHGRLDITCPPRWATATHRSLKEAGVKCTAAVVQRRAHLPAGFLPGNESNRPLPQPAAGCRELINI